MFIQLLVSLVYHWLIFEQFIYVVISIDFYLLLSHRSTSPLKEGHNRFLPSYTRFLLPSLTLLSLRAISIYLLHTISPHINTLRPWESRKWSPIKEAVDCDSNSPCQRFEKCKENSLENMHIRGAAFRNCFGFIDGTLRPICSVQTRNMFLVRIQEKNIDAELIYTDR